MPNTPSPQDWILLVQSKLLSAVDERPYRFKDTTWALAQEYLAERKQFAGLADDEIRALERQMRVRFPPNFRAYLVRMGIEHGMLFWGSESNPREFVGYHKQAVELVTRHKIEPFLTDKSVVFMFHQGFAFHYFEASESADSPVWEYLHKTPRPRLLARSFQHYIDDWVERIEADNAQEWANGGYYLTIRAGDGYQEIGTSQPAANETSPLRIGDRFTDR